MNDWHPDKFREVGKGAGHAVFDIFATDVSTDTIRSNWQRGIYGADKLRPNASMMAGWLKMAGRT